eukprot:2654637-Rhodomonas_salina.1
MRGVENRRRASKCAERNAVRERREGRETATEGDSSTKGRACRRVAVHSPRCAPWEGRRARAQTGALSSPYPGMPGNPVLQAPTWAHYQGLALLRLRVRAV